MIKQLKVSPECKTALSVLILACCAVLFLSGQAMAWEPRKPIEFIIMAGPGGGADKMARLMQSVIEKHKFSSKPFGLDRRIGHLASISPPEN